MNPQTIIIIVFVFLTLLMLSIYLITKSKQTVKCYKKLAEKYNFKVDNSKAAGVYRNRNVIIESFLYEVGGKKLPATRTIVQCENPFNLRFIISKKTSANKILYGADAVRIGDEEMDDKLIFNTNDLELFKRLFTFNSKFKIAQVVDLGFKGEVRTNENSLVYIDYGYIRNETDIMKTELMLHELCDLADEIKFT